MTKKDVMAVYQIKHEHEILKKRVIVLKKRLLEVCGTIDERIPEYTGWFVLLKKDSKRREWKFVGFYNPDTAEENTEPEWDLCMPIPKPESVEEFCGW